MFLPFMKASAFSLILFISVSCGSEVGFRGASGDFPQVVPESTERSADARKETRVQTVSTEPPEGVYAKEDPTPEAEEVLSHIVFGDESLFHIGDDDFGGSSCRMDIESLNYSGKRYVFNFSVDEDDTEVNIEIKQICGVDLATSNFISIYQGETHIYTETLSKGIESLTVPTSYLNAGEASLIIQSNLNRTEVNIFGGNHDDFIIGNINIVADKKINPGTVTIE